MRIKLIDPINVVEGRVNVSLAKLCNDVLKGNRYKITNTCRRLAIGWISNCPEMIALSSGELSGMFGLYEGSEVFAADSIVSAIAQSVHVDLVLVNNSFTRGGLSINFQPDNFINLLSLPEGHVVYEGGDLHWLSWLLQAGDSMIVANYRYTPSSGLGRSNKGIMGPGGSFRVPPEYSGTDSNNFIHRALVGQEQVNAINNLLKDMFL